MMKPLRISLVSLLLLAVSCTSIYSPPRLFPPAQEDFATRLRWLDLPGASRHFAPELRQEFLERLEGNSSLHITDVRLESADYIAEAGRMLTWTTIEYYQLPSTTVRTHRFLQEWEYSGEERFKAGNWHISTPFPELPTRSLRQ